VKPSRLPALPAPCRRAWLRATFALAGAGLAARAPASPGAAGGDGAAGVLPSARPAAGAAPSASADPVRRGRAIVLPRDHGAHLGSRIEWWYVTGWLRPGPAPRAGTGPGGAGTADAGAEAPGDPRALRGFQITFFRTRTGLAEDLGGRFAPRHLLFAHAALSTPATGRHEHEERIGRWSGEPVPSSRVRAALHDADLRLFDWTLRRQATGHGTLDARWDADFSTGTHRLQLRMARTQAVLLQGEAGWSRKGPQPQQASHYLSEPQLRVEGQVQGRDGAPEAVHGRAWLDHEWSDELLHPEAVGWDWIGINLDDGSALTAFRLRRADGSALWAGGSFRAAGAVAAPAFGPDEVVFTPGRIWRSPGSGAGYPVEWTVATPAGTHGVRALMDAQEMLGRSATGTVYWEGLSTLHAADGRRVGLGYLEMTGYAGRLVL
jgi:predicted secreted hydrolase